MMLVASERPEATNQKLKIMKKTFSLIVVFTVYHHKQRRSNFLEVLTDVPLLRFPL